MATRKSQLVLTCNAQAIKDVFNYLNDKLAEIKTRRDALLKQYEGKMWTAEAKREFKQLGDDIAAITSMQQKNEEEMRKYGQVMQDLANSKLRDVKGAVREVTNALNKMTENDPNRQKLIDDLAKLKNEIAVIGGSRRSLTDVTKDLKDLSNVRFDHLQQDLEAVRAEYAKLSEAQRKSPAGQTLKNSEKLLEAQIGVTQYGRAGNANIQNMNAEQLKAEQTRLRSGYMATQGAQGYEAISEEYLNRLQAVNQALKDIGNVNLKAVMNDLATGNANLEEMEQALKQVREHARQLILNNDPGFKKYQEDAEKLEQAISEIKDKMQGIGDIDYEHLENVPTEKLEAALKRLEEQEKKLAGTQKKEAEDVYRKKALIQQQLQRNKAAVQGVAEAEKVAANMGKYNVNQLKAAYETLQQKLMMLSTSQKREIARTKEKMAALKKKIDEVTGSVKQQSTIWQTAVRNITAYVGVFGAFNFIKDKVMQVFEKNKELSDSLANIRKVSGLTQDSINQLYTNIAKIDTRNSVAQLNELAYAGAKLGVQEHGGANALLGFVKAAEQVQMALGEDLGEEALPAMAKLTEVMGLMDMYGVEEAMQKAASAIFMLSTTSTSTGAQIIEFSKRLMGLANVSHISASELLALGSASDAMGLMAEVSSTAFNKVFTKIQSNTAAIEKAVGVAQGSLKSLVDEGKTMEAIVTVFDKMREMSMEEMQRRGIFTALGSDGARLNNVMTTMADRVDILKKHLDTANKSFEEGEAVIAEYMIQNQTAAAYIERASNAFEKAFTNPEGVDAVTDLAKQWHDLATELTNSTLMMGSMKAALWLVLQVVKGLIVVLPTLIQFLLFKGALVAVTQMVTGFINMSKAIWAAVTASKALTAAQKWNGITTALSIAAAAFMTIKSAMNEAAEATERARQRQAELDKQFDASKDVINLATKKLEDYKKALDESNLSQEERDRKLRAYIKQEYQPYLDYLGIEIDKVEDLADAYAQVTYAMKQKAAAEEKQNYLNNANGENRNNRIAAQAELIREAKKMGVEIDKKWLESNWGGGAGEIYNLITSKYQGSQFSESEGWKEIDAGGRKAYVAPAINKAAKEYYEAIKEETAIIKKTEEMFNAEYKDLDLEHFSLEKFREDQLKAQIEREKNRKNSIDLPPTKEELKEQREADRKAKEALRKDLQDAKQESDAVISKIEEWYRLQETVITDMATDGKLTQEQAEQVIRTLNIAKNTALRDARLAISGRDTEAWEQTKQQIGDLMLDQGKWSKELLEQILKVSMEGIRNNLARIDKGGGQYGITTTSLKDAVDKNAAGNQREISRLMNKGQQEVEKLLLQYHFVEQAMKGFSDRLAQMGILTETAKHMAERLADASNAETLYSMKDYNTELATNEQAKRDMMQAFVASGATPYGVNPENKEELRQWFMEFVGEYQQNEKAVGGVEYVYKSWAKPFQDDFELWLRNKEAYAQQIQEFYFSLMQSSDEYYKAQRQQYEFYKKQNEQQWENSGRKGYYEQTYTQLENQQKMQDAFGTGQNFAQQYGLADVIAEDPEVKLYQEKLRAAAEYYQFVESHQHTDKELREAAQAALEAYMAMAQKVSSEITERAAKIKELQQPATEAAEAIGQKLGDMMLNLDSSSDSWNAIVKKMILGFATMTIKMTAENLTKKIQQALFYKQMLAMETEHQTEMLGVQLAFGTMRLQAQQGIDTALQAQKSINDATTVSKEASLATILTAMGISEGAAKTIGQLGWWGIPLVAVIAALLTGLLASALSTAGKSSDISTKAATNATKTKLVSGMLTYDEGNVQYVAMPSQQQHRGLFANRRKLYDDGTTQVYDRPAPYLGNDGHVYMATPKGNIPEGVSLVRKPIATTVNGQPALVAEKGPEIVIGRKTTQRLMMDEPRLLHHLAMLGNGSRYASAYRGLRTFDDGNVTETVPYAALPSQPSPSSERDSAEREALTQTLVQLTATVAALQGELAKGIKSTVDMYGHGGLDESLTARDKFRRCYPTG